MPALESTGSPTTRGRASGHFTIHEEKEDKQSTAGATSQMSLVSQLFKAKNEHFTDSANRLPSMDTTPVMVPPLYQRPSSAICRLSLEQNPASRQVILYGTHACKKGFTDVDRS